MDSTSVNPTIVFLHPEVALYEVAGPWLYLQSSPNTRQAFPDLTGFRSPPSRESAERRADEQAGWNPAVLAITPVPL